MASDKQSDTPPPYTPSIKLFFADVTWYATQGPRMEPRGGKGGMGGSRYGVRIYTLSDFCAKFQSVHWPHSDRTLRTASNPLFVCG